MIVAIRLVFFTEEQVMSANPIQNVPLPETVERDVEDLLAVWRKQTAMISSSTVLVSHPAYRKIIALGAAALPYLFRDLEQTHDGHLSRALAEITGAQPVQPGEGGKIRLVAERWLKWARENGYQW
jgi:hypothetical protein